MAAISLGLVVMPLLSPSVARGAEYAMATVADYAVDPVAGAIAVSVEVTFTNTTPDPAGKLSAFDRIDLAIHPGATQVAAADAKGSLAVTVAIRNGATVASVKPRARVRYNRTVTFTLSYRLANDATPDVRVRPEVVKFAAYGFGTASQVTVELPAAYEVRADGDPMVTASDANAVRLTSGPISDPGSWLALITASRPTTFAMKSASVALGSGTVDLQVRAWSDDAAWGDRTLATLTAGLPMLERAIGLPYPRVGPLVVSEAVGGGGFAGDLPVSSAEVQAAFDGSDFSLLHQAAHIWIGDQLASDRWIREGLASHYAEQVATALGMPLPYEPIARTGELAASAFPLASWGVQGSTAAGDAYGYAASWAFTNQISTAVGEAGLSRALERIVTGVSAYDPVGQASVAPSGPGFAPVDTRRLLDQLAAAGGVDLADAFAALALGPGSALALAERTSARVDYSRLVEAAGDWGAPQPIRAAMAAWRFDEANAAMAAATAWLAQRDLLIGRVTEAGLSTPTRLRDRYLAAGGGPDAQAELDAERAMVDAYLAVQRRAAAPRGILEAIGLFAAGDPRQLLTDAATSFAAGDMRAAAEGVDRAQVQLDRGPTNGVVRITSAAVLLGVIYLLLSRSPRRRAGSHYTAAP